MFYSSTVENNKTTLHLTRKFSVNFMYLESKYYPALREFYQFVRTGDEQQVLLESVAGAGAGK
jgi:hypothetical protein